MVYQKATPRCSWDWLVHFPSPRLPTLDDTHSSLPPSLPTNLTCGLPSRYPISLSSKDQKTKLSLSSFLPIRLSSSVQTFWKRDNIYHPNPSKLWPNWWPQRPLPHHRDAWNPVTFPLAKLQHSSEANFPDNMLICIPMVGQSKCYLSHIICKCHM